MSQVMYPEFLLNHISLLDTFNLGTSLSECIHLCHLKLKQVFCHTTKTRCQRDHISKKRTTYINQLMFLKIFSKTKAGILDLWWSLKPEEFTSNAKNVSINQTNRNYYLSSSLLFLLLVWITFGMTAQQAECMIMLFLLWHIN